MSMPSRPYSAWSQPIRTRLQAAFGVMFVLMLAIALVGVGGMRTTLETLTGFREEVMPELARVLELAEKVSQLAAIAPTLADSYAPDTLPADVQRLQALMGDIQHLSLTLPPQAASKLEVDSMLEGSGRDLEQLLLLSGDKRLQQQQLDSYRLRLDYLLDQLGSGPASPALRAPTLLPLWQTLQTVPLARDNAALGMLEANAEAQLAAMLRRGELQRLPSWLGIELEVICSAPQNLFERRRQVLHTEGRIALLLQLYRSNAENLSLRTAAYVQELRTLADQRSRSVQGSIRSGISGLTVLAAVGVLVALLAAGYVRRVAQQMQSISRVMGRLAAGDTAQATPATERADEIGELARAFQVFRDNLLEKQRLTQGLETQRRLLQTVFANMNDGLSVYDADGALMVWNPQFPALLGIDPARLSTGLPYTALRTAMPAGTRWQAVATDTAAHTADGRERIASAAELHLPGGRVLEFCSRAMPEGGWVAVCRDVSARRAAEAQLQQMQKMEVLGQLTGGVAHDFNNFLVAILGNLELLEQRTDLPDDARRRLERAHGAANKAAALTRRLLAFARRQPLTTEIVDLDDMLQEMLDLIEYSVGDGIVVTVQAEPGLHVCIDRGQLENAVLNLALNAAQAMPDGGHLDLVARREEGANPLAAPALCLEVRDTGSGIPPEVLPHVLEPFFTTKEQGKGSGLGLSIVYGFLRQSGGDVGIDSTPGRGTTIRLWLPPAAPHCALERGPGPLPTVLPPRRVLLVDDDPDVRDTAVALLQQLGATVHAVGGEAAALAWLASGGEADLVLSDVMLGEGGDGVHLYRRLQQERPGLVMVLTSGLPPEYHARRSDWPAGVRFLAKPYTLPTLASLLATDVS
ncbi:PAS-domain containing protein [Vogesella sp. LYT5W]|uniref:histidine kinase n=1 Tax=Vogesella margarita TaxID=2984199 RepID=A0ABT5IPN2_9NEIS|nr:ATP-binding protein [Vogesella margarita]MDC7714245.1 PAS-domain containing protein [Vogesella margarita]